MRLPATRRGTSNAKCVCSPRELRINEFRSHLRKEGYEPVVESEKLHVWRKSEAELANYKYKGERVSRETGNINTFFRTDSQLRPLGALCAFRSWRISAV